MHHWLSTGFFVWDYNLLFPRPDHWCWRCSSTPACSSGLGDRRAASFCLNRRDSAELGWCGVLWRRLGYLFSVWVVLALWEWLCWKMMILELLDGYHGNLEDQPVRRAPGLSVLPMSYLAQYSGSFQRTEESPVSTSTWAAAAQLENLPAWPSRNSPSLLQNGKSCHTWMSTANEMCQCWFPYLIWFLGYTSAGWIRLVSQTYKVSSICFVYVVQAFHKPVSLHRCSWNLCSSFWMSSPVCSSIRFGGRILFSYLVCDESFGVEFVEACCLRGSFEWHLRSIMVFQISDCQWQHPSFDYFTPDKTASRSSLGYSMGPNIDHPRWVCSFSSSALRHSAVHSEASSIASSFDFGFPSSSASSWFGSDLALWSQNQHLETAWYLMSGGATIEPAMVTYMNVNHQQLLSLRPHHFAFPASAPRSSLESWTPSSSASNAPSCKWRQSSSIWGCSHVWWMIPSAEMCNLSVSRWCHWFDRFWTRFSSWSWVILWIGRSFETSRLGSRGKGHLDLHLDFGLGQPSTLCAECFQNLRDLQAFCPSNVRNLSSRNQRYCSDLYCDSFLPSFHWCRLLNPSENFQSSFLQLLQLDLL